MAVSNVFGIPASSSSQSSSPAPAGVSGSLAAAFGSPSSSGASGKSLLKPTNAMGIVWWLSILGAAGLIWLYVIIPA